MHKQHQSSALVRLLNNPWTASAFQPTVRDRIAAALRSLLQRTRGKAYNYHAPSITVLDLLPASGQRLSHLAALHLAPGQCIAQIAPLAISEHQHVPETLSAAQLATIVYQTVGVLPSSIPIDSCCITPAALVGRSGPTVRSGASAADVDADGKPLSVSDPVLLDPVLFDNVLFDRPIGVTVRNRASSSVDLDNNILFRAHRVYSQPPRPDAYVQLSP